jgi:hypothetical protein
MGSYTNKYLYFSLAVVLHSVIATSKDQLYRLDLEVERYQRENETLEMFVSDV